MRTFSKYEQIKAARADKAQLFATAAAILCHRTGKKTAPAKAVFALVHGIQVQSNFAEQEESICRQAAAMGRELPDDRYMADHDPGIDAYYASFDGNAESNYP